LLPELAQEQRRVADSVAKLQRSVCLQVAQGVVETLGIPAWPCPDRIGVWVQLPIGADVNEVAKAVRLEGASARPASDGNYLLLDVQPWFDTEEIEHTVLCCAKVLHVMLGIHPPDIDLEAHLADGNACHWQPQKVSDAADD
jgi:hypothetical protein